MPLPARPMVLVIMDGWGYRTSPHHNAIAAAETPHWDSWWQTHPHTLIDASAQAVGLPAGQMGNSEVGHMHIGAGRRIPQDFTRINAAVADGEFAKNAVFNQVFATTAERGALHILGLLSPGGVHSHETHIHALIQAAQRAKVKKILLHAFLDGRDTPPKSAAAALARTAEVLAEGDGGYIASIAGRYYAMDRDKRWERTARAYACLTEENFALTAQDPLTALEAAYARGETDEFVQPTRIVHPQTGPITDGDSVIFMNFRADRARQLTSALVAPDFTGFVAPSRPKLAHFVTLTRYSKALPTEVAYPPQLLQHTLGGYLAELGLAQLRIAETEKYAHVTFFFNGGQEEPFAREERLLVPSPAVATYDKQPEMSAPEVTERLISAIRSQQFDVIICNYANPDMVGHTGNYAATLQAIHCVDSCLGQVAAALAEVGGEMLITADHGNAETMFDPATQQPHTAHTCEPVPLLYLGRAAQATRSMGSLIDVAPTLLALLNLPIPQEMTGEALFAVV